jgi:transposase
MRTISEGWFAYMVDHIVDASARGGRIDIRTGVGRRRRWSDEAKGRVVAESYEPGAVVSEVARQHDITPQHLFAWRKAARGGRLVLPVEAPPMFVPVVTAMGELGADDAVTNRAGSIVIEIAGAVIRVDPGVDVGWLRDVLRAVKAAT